MDRFLATYHKVLRHIATTEKIVAVGFLFAMVASILSEIIYRFFFGRSLTWVLELTTYLFIWSVFMGASYSFKQIRHITIISYNKLNAKTQRVLSVVVNSIIISTMLLFLFEAQKVMRVEAQTTTASLPVELPRFLFYSLPMSLSAALIIVTGVYFILVALFAPKTDGKQRPIEAENAETGAVY